MSFHKRIALSLTLLLPCVALSDEKPKLPDSPRVTPAVRVIRQIEDSVAALFQVNQPGGVSAGGGVIIHPDGFVLTNNHVLKLNDGYALIGPDLPVDQKPVRFVVAGRLPERDLAIVKLLAPGPFPYVPLGRSNDILNGEPVVVAGNPGGRGTVFTSGIISSKLVLSGFPNALAMTNYKNSRRPRFIQFDAPSNAGNSGGPLVNMEGRLIGIVSQKIYQEQNVGFAIPIDDVYRLIERIVEPELFTRQSVGISITSSFDQPKVAAVSLGSAAEKAGVKKDDIIESIGGREVSHEIDWFLGLRDRLNLRKPFPLTVKRGDEQMELSIEPEAMKPQQAAEVDSTKLKRGLTFEVCHGKYSLLPDFEKEEVKLSGVTDAVELKSIEHGAKEYFAIRMQGLLQVPADALYRLVIMSDDGSKVTLHDEVIIDNDGNHPPLGSGRLVYLQKGYHPLQVEYFQGNGGMEMQMVLEIVGRGARPVAGELIWHEPKE